MEGKGDEGTKGEEKKKKQRRAMNKSFQARRQREKEGSAEYWRR